MANRALPEDAAAHRPPEDDDFSKAAFPVFIIGSPRSGTSILSAALHAAGYSGYDEGHLLSLIRVLSEVVDSFFATHDLQSDGQLLSHVDNEKIKRAMALVLKTFQVGPTREPWVDKTPGTDMYFAAPYIQEFWPTAKFIFAKRRGIENIVSRMKKFPDAPFADHCEDWASTMSGWRVLRDTGLDYIEIDQMDIARQPMTAAKRLCRLPGPAKARDRRHRLRNGQFPPRGDRRRRSRKNLFARLDRLDGRADRRLPKDLLHGNGGLRLQL